MQRALWSSARFDRALGILFEKLEGRADEIQARLDQLVQVLLDGSLTMARQHHMFDDTCCVPLIDAFVIVFRPDSSNPKGWDADRRHVTVDISAATRIGLL